MADYVDDPDDGLPVAVVGAWSEEKHERLRRYVDASRAVRRMYMDRSEASYIDLFCGPGRAKIEGKDRFIDGGAVAACRMAREKGVPFSIVHIGDTNSTLVDACVRRLEALGERVVKHQGPAEKTVDEVSRKLNPHGLHLAYLDPYNLGTLPFSIIERLASIKRMDMILHVSKQDLQRNLARYFKSADSPLHRFAPGWRSNVDNSSVPNLAMRAAVVSHWLDLVRSLDMAPSRAELITGSRGQHLYWLIFASRSDRADGLWTAIRNLGGQRELPV